MSQNSKNVVFQRKHLRINLELNANLSILFSELKAKPLPTEVKMLGCGGLMLVSPIPLVKGTRVEMELFHGRKSIPFTAEVVWSRKPLLNKINSSQCGLKFLNISQDALLRVHQILYNNLFKSQKPSRPKKKLS